MSQESQVPAMATVAERLVALKEKLEAGREENLKVAEQEQLKLASVPDEGSRVEYGIANNDQPGRNGWRESAKRCAKRNRILEEWDVGSADEADGENEDERLRSIKRRSHAIRNLCKPISANVSHQALKDGTSPDNDNGPQNVLVYGGAGSVDEDALDNMVGELERVEKRRAKYRRRRAFDEDRADITFINEGNRLFNRTLDRHFDKFDSVKEIKDNLERGTA